MLHEALPLDPAAEPEKHELGVADWDAAVVGDPAYDLSARGAPTPRTSAAGSGRS